MHQWRRLSSVSQDIFRSGGLPCGSLPETLPLLSKLWTRPRRQYQWDYTYAPCIQTAYRLFSRPFLPHGRFGMRAVITTSLHRTVCIHMLTREFTASSLSSISPVEEVFLKDVSCYFSLLEDGQPRDKLECEFLFSFVPKIVMTHLAAPLSFPFFLQLLSGFMTEMGMEFWTAL